MAAKSSTSTTLPAGGVLSDAHTASPFLLASAHVSCRVDRDTRRHAGPDTVLIFLIAEADAHRQALHDADKITRGIVRRKQRERRTCAAGDALHPAVESPHGDA